MKKPTIIDFVYNTMLENASYDGKQNAYVIDCPRIFVDLIASRTSLTRTQVLNALSRLGSDKKIIYRGINNPLTIPSSKPAPQPEAKPEQPKVRYVQMSLDELISNPEKAFEALVNNLIRSAPEPEVKPEPEPEPVKSCNELVADAIEKVVNDIQKVSVCLKRI